MRRDIGTVSFSLVAVDSNDFHYPIGNDETELGFEILDALPLIELVPSVGPVMGGTLITLKGWYDSEDRVVACVLGRHA